MVVEQLDTYTSRSAEEERATNNAENAEWGSNAAQSMMDKTRGFPIHFGNGKQTLADMYEKTPKNLISKVSLEEKIFETWSGGRIVLLGDGMSFSCVAGKESITRRRRVALVLTFTYFLFLLFSLSQIEPCRRTRYTSPSYPFQMKNHREHLELTTYILSQLFPTVTITNQERSRRCRTQ